MYFLTFPACFWIPIIFSNLNSNCSDLLDMRYLKNFANSRPSAWNFKSFSLSLGYFFSQVGQNNFGNKIPDFLCVLLGIYNSNRHTECGFYPPCNLHNGGKILGEYILCNSLDGGLTMTLRNNKHPNSSTLPLELHNTNAKVAHFYWNFHFCSDTKFIFKRKIFRPHYIFHMYALLGSMPRCYSKMKFDHFFEQMDNLFSYLIFTWKNWDCRAEIWVPN